MRSLTTISKISITRFLLYKACAEQKGLMAVKIYISVKDMNEII